MNKPTKEKIASEIAAMKALKPVGPWKRKTEASIELVLCELEHGFDDTSAEWDELDEEQQDTVLMTRAWKEGQNNDAPSDGWKGLVA